MISEIQPEFDDDSNEMPSESNQPFTVYKCKEVIHDNLLSSGQRDLLKRMMQNRLAQTGWTYSLRMECIEYIKRRGVENVNVSHMIEDIHSVGRARFPDDIRNELYNFLLDFAKTYVDVDESAPPPTETDTAYSSTGFTFNYQGRDVIPDPGLGVGVVTSTTDESTSTSCSSPSITSEDEENEDIGSGSPGSRSLTPQPSDLPLLLPENLEMLEPQLSGSEEEEDGEGEMEGEVECEGEEEEEVECDEDGEEVYVEGYDVEIEEGGEEIEGEYLIGDQIEFEGDCGGFLGLEAFGEGGIEVELEDEGQEHEEDEGNSSNATNNEEVDDDIFDRMDL